MRDGVKHTRVAGVLFCNFHARLLNTGRLLAPNIWGQYSEKIAAFKTALSYWAKQDKKTLDSDAVAEHFTDLA